MPANRKPRTGREAVLARALETIADLQAELGEVHAQLSRTELAYDAEVAFWKKEVARLQEVAVNAVISAAGKK